MQNSLAQAEHPRAHHTGEVVPEDAREVGVAGGGDGPVRVGLLLGLCGEGGGRGLRAGGATLRGWRALGPSPPLAARVPSTPSSRPPILSSGPAPSIQAL